MSKAIIFNGQDIFAREENIWEAPGGKIRDEVGLRKSLRMHGVSLL